MINKQTVLDALRMSNLSVDKILNHVDKNDMFNFAKAIEQAIIGDAEPIYQVEDFHGFVRVSKYIFETTDIKNKQIVYYAPHQLSTVEAERDRYKVALEEISKLNSTTTNFGVARVIAQQALDKDK